ncbi:MAG: helix-turn-helix domain-containing protein [Firmicutes bacterium]|nr:helix-turn-helix domain-containing protein [Bacillota bacterium]
MKNNLFCQQLKELREQHELTQQKLANLLSIPRGTLSYWELGLSPPSMFGLIALADYFDVSIDYLVGRENYPI